MAVSTPKISMNLFRTHWSVQDRPAEGQTITRFYDNINSGMP